MILKRIKKNRYLRLEFLHIERNRYQCKLFKTIRADELNANALGETDLFEVTKRQKKRMQQSTDLFEWKRDNQESPIILMIGRQRFRGDNYKKLPKTTRFLIDTILRFYLLF